MNVARTTEAAVLWLTRRRLRSRYAFVRERAAKDLGRSTDPRAVEALVAALRDEDFLVQQAASEALGRIGSPAVERLIVAVGDLEQRSMARLVAVEALGSTGDARAVDPLLKVLQDGDDLRSTAATALGAIGDPRALTALVAVLSHGEYTERVAAVRALGKIGDARAVEPLMAALADLCIEAREALDAIDPNWRASTIAMQAVPRLVAALKDTSAAVRCRTAEALREIGDTRAVEPLVAALEDADKDARRAAANALKEIGGPAAEAAVSDFDWRACLPARVVEFRCGGCSRVLEEIGVPAQISFLQGYGQVINTGAESVPAEVKADPYLYRGFYCPNCNQVFCPACAGMQSEHCPRCHQPSLMPGYRPLLKRIAAQG